MYITMTEISKNVNDVAILKKVNFKVEKNQIHGLVGINGSGKSTLMKVLMGLIVPDSGIISINSKALDDKRSLFSEKMMMVHQSVETLVDDLSVAENLFLGRLPQKRFGRIDWKKLNIDAKEHLQKLDFDIDANEKVENLNYCQKRMLEVAMALTMDIKLLILDEVYIGLEQYDQIKFLKLLKKIKDSGMTIIYISNKLKSILDICDEISIMSHGKIVKTIDKEEFDNSRIIEDMLKKESKSNYPKITTNKNHAILKLSDVSTRRLKNINFTLFEGEVLGVTGLIRSGCTALAETIFGIQSLNFGNIKIYNNIVKINSPKDAIDNGIGYVPNEQQFDDMNIHFNAIDNIFFPDIKNPKTKSGKYQKFCAEKYLHNFHITNYKAADFVKRNDWQNYKKISFARWHHLNSKIMIFDEPTRPLDVPSKIDFYNYLNYLAGEERGVLFISTDIDELIGTCDRILVVYNGTIVKCFHRSDFHKNNILRTALGME